MNHSADDPELFLLDIRRAFLLHAYIEHWGMPEFRVTSRNRELNEQMEVYVFPGSASRPIHRFATVGVSCHRTPDGHTDRELMLALPNGLGGATSDQVVAFMLDLGAYAMHAVATFDAPMQIPESPRAPAPWKTRALLIDEATGEAEEFSDMMIGNEMVKVLWVVPIYGSEYSLIKQQGIERFDELAQRSDLSLVDIDRPPLV